MSDAFPQLFGSTAAGESPESDAALPIRWQAPAGNEALTYLSSLAVDGFGKLAGLVVELRPGLNVVLGENEAGKSTLFDFVAGVLFGFPRQKADDRFRLPVRGGRHGGAIEIVHPDGSLRVERHGQPSRQLAVLHRDGSTASESDLAQILGGASKDVFRTVFAVDLDDLRRLDGLGDEAVREVLFSSSVLGQRRSAARALAELEGRCDELVRPRQGGLANSVLAELRQARSALAVARTEAARHPQIRFELERCAEALAELQAEREQARDEQSRLELLERCWPIVVGRCEASQELESMGELSAGERAALDLADAVRRLREEWSGHLARRSRAAELRDTRRPPIATSVRERVVRLGVWAADVAGDRAVDLDDALAQADRLVEASSGAAAEHEAALAQLSAAEADLAVAEAAAAVDQCPWGDCTEQPPDRPTLERSLASLRSLRGLVVAHDSARRDLELLAARTEQQAWAAPPASSAPPGSLVALGTALLVLLGVAALLGAGRQAALAGAAAVAAVAVGAALLTALAHGRRRHTPPHRRTEGAPATSALLASRSAEVAALAQRIDAEAAAQGLSPPIALVAVEGATSELELRLEERRRYDELERTRTERAGRLQRARGAEARAAARLDTVRKEVEELALRCRIPVSTDARAAVQLLRELAELRDRQGALERMDDELDEIGRWLRVVEDRMAAIASDLGIACSSGPGAGAEELLFACEGVVAQAEERSERRRALADQVSASDGELDRQLGRGEQAGALRRDLETGQVLEWQERSARSRARCEEAERKFEEQLREHERLALALQAVEQSDEVARLALDVAALEARLDVALRDYLETSAARMLVRRTLRRYEEERQPAVLERAGEHFSRVTGGRYVRVLVDPADGPIPAIQVIEAGGARLDAHVLSRGTIDQLYLCLRLALAEIYAARAVALPIVLDDVLVNFDPARTTAMAAEVAETAVHHQVVAFTCHPHMAEILLAAAAHGPPGAAPGHLLELPG